MKKYLAVLLAFVLTLSFFTFTARAADGATTYVLACSACGNRTTYVLTEGLIQRYRSTGCDAYDGDHVHYDIYDQRAWGCYVDGCPAKDIVLRFEKLIVESDICFVVRPNP